MQVKFMMYSVHSGGIRWQIHDLLSDGHDNACFISHRLRDVAKQEKCQNYDLDNEGQESTRNVRIYIGDLFSRI